MKIRNGFVSNSSSSSFLIPINAVRPYQIEMIIDHIDAARIWLTYHKDMEMNSSEEDKWVIEVNEKCVFGYTFMDNFDMNFFLENIANVNQKYIYWGDFEYHSSYSLDIDQINREILQEERKDKLENIEKNNKL